MRIRGEARRYQGESDEPFDSSQGRVAGAQERLRQWNDIELCALGGEDTARVAVEALLEVANATTRMAHEPCRASPECPSPSPGFTLTLSLSPRTRGEGGTWQGRPFDSPVPEPKRPVRGRCPR